MITLLLSISSITVLSTSALSERTTLALSQFALAPDWTVKAPFLEPLLSWRSWNSRDVFGIISLPHRNIPVEKAAWFTKELCVRGYVLLRIFSSVDSHNFRVFLCFSAGRECNLLDRNSFLFWLCLPFFEGKHGKRLTGATVERQTRLSSLSYFMALEDTSKIIRKRPESDRTCYFYCIAVEKATPKKETTDCYCFTYTIGLRERCTTSAKVKPPSPSFLLFHFKSFSLQSFSRLGIFRRFHGDISALTTSFSDFSLSQRACSETIVM